MSVSIGEVFPLLLAAKPAVVALAVDRFFPNRLPQRDSMPAVVFEKTGGSPVPALEDFLSTCWATFRLVAVSTESQEQASELLAACLTIKTVGARIGDWWIQSLRPVQGSDSDEPQLPQHGDDKPDFQSSIEFMVFYKPGGS